MTGKALLCYSTTVSVEKSVIDVEDLLAKHNARQIVKAFDAQGRIEALCWTVETMPGVFTPFRMPVVEDACQRVLNRQYKQGGMGVTRGQTTPEHARMVAWRILKEWTEAQMALIETEMATMAQVFLPYMTAPSGQTLFEAMQERGFKMLGPGEEK